MYGKDTNLSGRILFSIFSANGLKFESVQPEEDVGPTDNFRWENMHLLIFGHQHVFYALSNQRTTNPIICMNLWL